MFHNDSTTNAYRSSDAIQDSGFAPFQLTPPAFTHALARAPCLIDAIFTALAPSRTDQLALASTSRIYRNLGYKHVYGGNTVVLFTNLLIPFLHLNRQNGSVTYRTKPLHEDAWEVPQRYEVAIPTEQLERCSLGLRTSIKSAYVVHDDFQHAAGLFRFLASLPNLRYVRFQKIFLSKSTEPDFSSLWPRTLGSLRYLQLIITNLAASTPGPTGLTGLTVIWSHLTPQNALESFIVPSIRTLEYLNLQYATPDRRRIPPPPPIPFTFCLQTLADAGLGTSLRRLVYSSSFLDTDALRVTCTSFTRITHLRLECPTSAHAQTATRSEEWNGAHIPLLSRLHSLQFLQMSYHTIEGSYTPHGILSAAMLWRGLAGRYRAVRMLFHACPALMQCVWMHNVERESHDFHRVQNRELPDRVGIRQKPWMHFKIMSDNNDAIDPHAAFMPHQGSWIPDHALLDEVVESIDPIAPVSNSDRKELNPFEFPGDWWIKEDETGTVTEQLYY